MNTTKDITLPHDDDVVDEKCDWQSIQNENDKNKKHKNIKE